MSASTYGRNRTMTSHSEPQYTSHEWDYWLEIIERDGVNLSAWEEEFIESIRLQRDRHRELSSKQADTLERIYAARTRCT